MPCTSFDIDDYKYEAGRATRLLCEAMAKMPPDLLAQQSDELRQWWADHQERDRRRLAETKARIGRLEAEAIKEDAAATALAPVSSAMAAEHRAKAEAARKTAAELKAEVDKA